MAVLAMRDGKPWFAFGTPGGFGQTQTHLQVLNDILLFGMTPQEAIDAPRMVRMLTGTIMLEDRFPMNVPATLRERGHTVGSRGSPANLFGGAQAILIDQESGALRAGADRHREGFALAY
jgi:gamma-glutamyltranspeptidase